MPNASEDNSLMSAGRCVQPAELGDDGWFLPVVIEPPKQNQRLAFLPAEVHVTNF